MSISTLKFFLFLLILGSSIVRVGSVSAAIEIPNPLRCDDVDCVLSAVITFLLTVAVPILVIMIIWGAFILVTAGGSEEQIKKAKKTLMWSVIGFAIITIGWGIAEIVKEILGGGST